MKNKRLLTGMASTLMIFAIVGCSNAASSEEQTTTEQTTSKAGSTTAANFEEADVYGEVSEVIGNEVTLKLLEKPKMPTQNGEKGTARPDGTDKAAGSADTGTGANTDAGAAGSGAAGGGGMREKNYTGEEKTIVIPVGTPIVSMTRGDNGMEETEISINELVSGSTLSIYYQEDGKTIEKVSIRKQRTGGGMGGPGGEGGKAGN